MSVKESSLVPSGERVYAPPMPSPNELLSLVREARKLLAEAGEGSGPLRCDACEQPAPLEGSFCASCGKQLRFPCPRCSHDSHVRMGYCVSCGLELSAERVGEKLNAMSAAADARRRRRREDLLRRFSSTEVVHDGRVQHLIGICPDGTRAFVKIARSRSGRRLLDNEITRIRALQDHPGVARLIEARADDERSIAIFEHVPRTTIRFPVAIGRLLRIVSSVLDTLAHAHRCGVVHADLKPAHLLLRDDDTPVIIDWNIAQAPGPSLFDAFTPLFAAPEQIVGDEIDGRVDLYAVGVILYLLFTHDRFPAVLEEQGHVDRMVELLQARPAMNRAFLSEGTVYKGKLARLQQLGGDDGLQERRVLGAKYLFSSELSRTADVNADIRLTGEILAVVKRATAIDPSDRYPDAASMGAAVAALLGEVTGGDVVDP
ncbi:MAG TPA: hypothetical protein ENK18_11265 [Deltaproteobacteria bacterium]|nr:hypothetical protein [Deltaproteobacteria bacterium]